MASQANMPVGKSLVAETMAARIHTVQRTGAALAMAHHMSTSSVPHVAAWPMWLI